MENANIKVLIVDDDASILGVLETIMQRSGYEVQSAASSDMGLKLLKSEKFDLLISDIVIQPFDGLKLLQEARKHSPDTQVILMTGFASIETATKAMKLGAFDYICKPFKVEDLKAVIKRALDYASKKPGTAGDQQSKVTLVKRHFGVMIGNSVAFKAICKEIEVFARNDDPVLIHGASGTGKSLVADALQISGLRASRPFVSFHCAIYPEHLIDDALFGYVEMPTDAEGNVIKGLPVVHKGIIETTNGGTLFLEEVGALSLEFQEKILALLRNREIQRIGSDRAIHIDIRIIADSAEPLDNKVQKNEFLSELYELLKVQRIEVPPLRDRSGDVKLMIDYFLRQYNKQNAAKITIDPKVMRAMEHYSWPGNVRELRNAVFRSAQLAKKEKIQLTCIPVPIRMCFMRDDTSIFGYSDEFDLRWWSLKNFLKAKERAYVDQVLKMTKGDFKHAAEILGMDLAVFHRKYGGAN